MEDILQRSSTRLALRLLTRQHKSGKCLFEHLCENYENPALRGLQSWKWKLPTAAIHYGIHRAKLDNCLMKSKLFHHPPTVRALALTMRSIGRLGLSAPQRFVAPLMVVWNITNLCNLSCAHCYQNSSRSRGADELTLEQRLRVVRELAKNGVPFLAIAGGEPLTSKDLIPVIDEAVRLGIHVTLASNGTLLTELRAAELRDHGVKYIEISIDSNIAAEHDRFRHHTGAFEKAIQGIRNSVKAGVRTGLATCFTRHTAGRVDDMVRLAMELGCQTFSHFNFIPVGRGRAMAGEDLTPEQREMVLARLNDYLQENRINVISTAPQFARACIVYGPQDGLFAAGHAGRAGGAKAQVLSRYIGGCGAGRCYCCIQPDGRVTPCVYISGITVGDLKSQSLRAIWNNTLFDVLQDRDDRGDHCGVCDYRPYCGGCRARAHAYTDDITAGDPGCIYNRHEWDEIEAHEPHGILGADRVARAESAAR